MNQDILRDYLRRLGWATVDTLRISSPACLDEPAWIAPGGAILSEAAALEWAAARLATQEEIR